MAIIMCLVNDFTHVHHESSVKSFDSGPVSVNVIWCRRVCDPEKATDVLGNPELSEFGWIAAAEDDRVSGVQLAVLRFPNQTATFCFNHVGLVQWVRELLGNGAGRRQNK